MLVLLLCFGGFFLGFVCLFWFFKSFEGGRGSVHRKRLAKETMKLGSPTAMVTETIPFFYQMNGRDSGLNSPPFLCFKFHTLRPLERVERNICVNLKWLKCSAEMVCSFQT